MRGKARCSPRRGPRTGITPACAGKRRDAAHAWMEGEDHPRLCGEKKEHSFYQSTDWGSPPPVRGKGLVFSVGDQVHRITPACAGKRPPPDRCRRCPWDHPRLCGEKCEKGRCIAWMPGSPPPVRGKGLHLLVDIVGEGITPACAGKSYQGFAEQHAVQDHPRLCGEKSTLVRSGSTTTGSPPPVRGKG